MRRSGAPKRRGRVKMHSVAGAARARIKARRYGVTALRRYGVTALRRYGAYSIKAKANRTTTAPQLRAPELLITNSMDRKRSHSLSCDPKHSSSPSPSDNAKRQREDVLEDVLEVVLNAIKTGSVDALSEHGLVAKRFGDRKFLIELLHELGEKQVAEEIEGDSIVAVFRQFPEDMRDDMDVVREAVMNNADTFEHAGDGVKSDAATVLHALKYDAEMKHMNKDLLLDMEFVEELVDMQPYGVECLIKDIGDIDEGYITKEVALLLVKRDPTCLGDLPTEWGKDTDVVKAALLQDISAFRYASVDVHSDAALIKELLNTTGIGIKLKEYISFDDYKDVKTVIDDFEGK